MSLIPVERYKKNLLRTCRDWQVREHQIILSFGERLTGVEKNMDATIQTKIPEQLLRQAQSLIREGWISDLDALLAEALRRYLESHQSPLTESFIREDVEWGLHERE